MKVHILTENRVKKRGFLAEHGLSLLIEHEASKILFDTGQSNVYLHNADLMGLNLNEIDCVVLSHGHYDHCGGLAYYEQSMLFPKVYVHPAAFERKYTEKFWDQSYREIGIPWKEEDKKFILKHVVFNNKKLSIAPQITLVGAIPSSDGFEASRAGFYRGNKENKIVDTMEDEQMLIIETQQGLNLFLGCSHSGIINCLKHALELFPNKKIETLTAGMHLECIRSEHLQKTIQYMIDLDIQKIVPLHCTGVIAIGEMKRTLGEKCLLACAGETIEF